MSSKIWMLIATGFLAVGLILFAVVMSMYGWNFREFGNVGFRTNTYPVDEEFRSISMNTDTADITYVKSTDGSCRVVCYEKENESHSISVEDGVLHIGVSEGRKWYQMLLNFGKPKITVYLPETQYESLTIREDTGDVEIPQGLQFGNVDIAVSTGDVKFGANVSGMLKVKASTGHLTLCNLSAGSVDLSVSTGNVRAENLKCEGDIHLKVSTGDATFADVSCQKLISGGDTGNFTLQNVVAAGKISIERSTGDVKFEKCDGGEISVNTSTGDVTGSFLTDKIVYAHADTGKVAVPQSTSGGLCEIRTSTGDIKITIYS